jgi:glycosyltransferase involved in cell wall biosynthesis
MPVRPFEELPTAQVDVAIAVNEPDMLRGASGLRVCLCWLNEVSHLKVGFEHHVDLWQSPSDPHLRKMLHDPNWHKVDVSPTWPNGKAQWKPDPSQWIVVPLGCDPERYPPVEKVPGRIIYCSSPDRGLHWLLSEWPTIKRSAPHAHLKIFYRLEPWLRGFDNVKYFPPIERLRARAVYIEEALRRLAGPEWGIEVCDSVSRERIEQEMNEAEVFAYPCDTTSWSEGFSCSTLEACCARACPVITDCDALGAVYRDAAVVMPRGDWSSWRDNVIRSLTDAEFRESVNSRARAFAETHTWKLTTQKVLTAIENHQGVAA